MKYARFSKELGACHCSSFEKQKRGVGGGGYGGGRKEGERSHEGMESSPKELKGGNVTAENSPAND